VKVFILGAGKVGRALAAALKKHDVKVKLHAARKVLPKKPIDASIIVLALRDKQLGPFATELANGLVKKSTVVVHNAGSQSADAIAPLRGKCAGIAQMHPMISFASTSYFPSLKRGHVHVKGDGAAEDKARKLAKKLGMTPRTFGKKFDPIAYHAAAGLVANGAAALAAIGVELLAVAGVPRADAPKMLGPLLRSVADNVETLGFPDALTGPVRRGEAASIEKQLGILKSKLPDALMLYVASGLAQLPIAKKIGDASAKQIDEVGVVLRKALVKRA
jgi:predicted short-subunit dehydrogenase-like oxidoreductase (DUF2520 family)